MAEKVLRILMGALAIMLISSGCNANPSSNDHRVEANSSSVRQDVNTDNKEVNSGVKKLKIEKEQKVFGGSTFDPANKGVTRKFTVGENDSTVLVVTQAKVAEGYIQPPYVSITDNTSWKLINVDLLPKGFGTSDFTYAVNDFLYFQRDSNGKPGLYQYRISNEGKLGEAVYIPTSTEQESVTRLTKTTKGPAIIVKDEKTDGQKNVQFRVHLAKYPQETINFVDKFGAFAFNNALFDIENHKAYYIQSGKLKVFDFVAGEPIYQDGKDKIFYQFKSTNVAMEVDEKGNLFVLDDKLLQLFDHNMKPIAQSIVVPVPTVDPIFDPVYTLIFHNNKLSIWYYQEYDRKATINLITVTEE